MNTTPAPARPARQAAIEMPPAWLDPALAGVVWVALLAVLGFAVQLGCAAGEGAAAFTQAVLPAAAPPPAPA